MRKNLNKRRGKFSDEGQVKASGWFWKKRDTSNSLKIWLPWSKGYFTVEKDMVKWYKDSSKSKVLGVLNFHEILSIRVLNSSSRKEDQFNRDEYGTFGVVVSSPYKTLELRCETRSCAREFVLKMRQGLLFWSNRTGRERPKDLKRLKKHRFKTRNLDDDLKQKVLDKKIKGNVLKIKQRLGMD